MKETKRWLLYKLMHVGFLALLLLIVWAIAEPLGDIEELMRNYKPIIEHLKD